MLGKAGLSPKEHQDLARHSTYALTARYTHSRFYDLAAAGQGLQLPISGTAKAESELLRMTGTDGKSLGPFLGLRQDVLGHSERQTETEASLAGEQENPGKHAVFQGFPSRDNDLSKMEAPGIEPGSRGPSA